MNMNYITKRNINRLEKFRVESSYIDAIAHAENIYLKFLNSDIESFDYDGISLVVLVKREFDECGRYKDCPDRIYYIFTFEKKGNENVLHVKEEKSFDLSDCVSTNANLAIEVITYFKRYIDSAEKIESILRRNSKNKFCRVKVGIMKERRY